MNSRRAILYGLSVLLVSFAPVLRAAEESPERITRTFEAKPGGKLVLRADRGSITLSGTDQAQAEVEVLRRVVRGSGEKARELLENHVVKFSQEGSTIRVDAETKGLSRWSWSGPTLEVSFNVRIPHGFDVDVETAGGSVKAGDLRGDLQLRTSGGSLHLESLTGKIKASTSGGSIQAANLEGSADLGTSGGSITVEKARGTELKAVTSGGSLKLMGIDAATEARTSGGSITIEASGVPVNATTSAGSITATFSAAPKSDVSLKTSAGGIRVTVPANTGFDLDASTSAGGVSCDLPVASDSDRSKHRDSLKGLVNGGGPRLKLRTSAGSIKIGSR